MSRSETRTRSRHGRRGHRERGVAAIAMALLSVGIAGGAMVSFLLLRSQEAQVHTQQQGQLVAWAEHAVREFALTNGRLPCPASDETGAEACGDSGPASEGWLPLTPVNGGQNRERAGVRYMVDGVGDGAANLTAGNTPLFMPRLANGNPPEEYPTDIASSMDLCEKLGPDLPPLGDMVFGVAATPRGVTTSPFANAASVASLQGQGNVRQTEARTLYVDLGCDAARASLNTMAVVQAWYTVNEGNRTAGIRFADRIVTITGLSLAANVIDSVMQTADVANGVFNTAENTVKLAEATLVPVLAPFIPVHIAGQIEAALGSIRTGVDLTRSVLAIAMDAIYLAGYQAASNILGDFVVWTTGADMLERAHALGISYDMPPTPAPEASAPEGSGS